MPDTVAPPRRITTADLRPGPGLAPAAPAAWAVDAPHVRLTAPVALPAGWYEVRVAARSADRFTVRKRLELTFDPADGHPRPAAREAFAWNREFADRFLLRLTRPAASLRLDIWHAEGTLALDGFRVRPVSRPAALARAVREKVRLTRAYQCFGGAAWRGGRLLLRGRFGEFGRKLLRGLADARVMQVGAVRAGEVDAAWGRRHALPADEADRIRAAIDAMPDPPPLAVLLPVDAARVDAARVAAHAVRRQLYPHWQLVVAASGSAALAEELERLIVPDPRITVTRAPATYGWAAAVGRAVARIGCDRVLVLPPGVELAEHALYHFAAAVKADPDAGLVGGPLEQMGEAADPDAGHVWLARTRRLGDDPPADPTSATLARWVTTAAGGAARVVLEPVLAHSADNRPLADRARLGPPPGGAGAPLFLAADVRGISGYDQVAAACLKGLRSAGADVRLSRVGLFRGELFPHGFLPPVATRTPADPQLVMAAPFLVHRFHPDARTAVFTMWETDRLEPAWVAALNRAAVVVVPSRWGADCFRASGVTAPVAVAPLGYDPLTFHPGSPPPDVCTFGTAGALASGGLRKNAQRVIDLFRTAFPAEADVRLRVKITPGSAMVETYDDPRVDVIRAIMPTAELADWYRSLTAYANASAGEGFGLHLIEAMACGRPLITPAYSGLTEFFDPTVGYPVDYELVPVRNDIYTGHWAETDGDSVVTQMRRIYADRAEAARFGVRAATRATNFTWKAAGRALAAALREHGVLGAATTSVASR